MNNRVWDGTEEYVSPYGDLEFAKGFSDEKKLSQFRLQKGSKFLYVFDFGDEWRFSVKVLRVIDEPTNIPLILKSVGEISQYGYDDGDDDDYDEDDLE